MIEVAATDIKQLGGSVELVDIGTQKVGGGPGQELSWVAPRSWWTSGPRRWAEGRVGSLTEGLAGLSRSSQVLKALLQINHWPLLFLNNLCIYLFLIALHLGCCVGSSLVETSRVALESRCTGFLPQWLLWLQSTAFRVHGLQWFWLLGSGHRLSSCSTRALLLQSTWDLAGPGTKPVSPTLAGRFFYH